MGSGVPWAGGGGGMGAESGLLGPEVGMYSSTSAGMY